MDHLRELRNRLIKIVACIAVLTVAAYFLYDPIFRFFTHPYCQTLEGTAKECRFYLTDFVAGFTLRMKVAAYIGMIASLPVILWHLWKFIMPGLYKNERRYTIAFVASSIFLFALGAALAYLTIPEAIKWLSDAAGPAQRITEIPSPDRYFWFSALMMVGFGIGFEFPLLLVALQLVGVLDNHTLRRLRRHAAVIITIAVAVLTPGGDPISLLVLSVPMYLFYEMSILYGRLWHRRRRRKEAAAGAVT
jgi:sec-independent protein translocase protein TatC